MKRVFSYLITSLFVLGFALGAVGCSGDLMDKVLSYVDLSGGGAVGSFQDWNAATGTWDTTDDNVYTYEFIATAEEIQWKALSTKDWDKGFSGGSQKDPGLPVPLDGDEVKLEEDGPGAGNLITEGLTVGKSYKITVTCKEDGTATGKVESLDGGPNAPTPFRLEGYYIRGLDDASWNPKVENSLGVPEIDIATGKVTYTLTFATTTGTTFKIGKKDWGTDAYGLAATAAISSDVDNPTKLKFRNGESPDVSNIQLPDGISTGDKVIVVVTTDTDKNVYVAAYKPAELTLKFKVTGIDGSAQQVFITGDGVGGWTSKWPDGSIGAGKDYADAAAWVAAKKADTANEAKKIADVQADGTAEFTYQGSALVKDGADYQISGFKVIGVNASTVDWSTTLYDGDNDNTEFPKITGATTGTYLYTIDLSGMDVTGKSGGNKQKYTITVANQP